MNALTNIMAQVAARTDLEYPPLTEIEAKRAAKRFARKFGGVSLGGPSMVARFVWRGEVMKPWIAKRATTGDTEGMGRLIWNVAHDILHARFPTRTTSRAEHDKLRREMTVWALSQGWLVPGALATKPRPKKPPLTREQLRQRKIGHMRAQLKRWQTRHKFSGNRIKKLSRAIARQERAAALREADDGCAECERSNGPHYTGPCEHGGAA